MDITICAGCFQRIEGTFVRAFNQAFHSQCFKCTKCGYPIRESKYASENGQVYHGECLALLRGEVCAKCHKPIAGTVTTALARKWHPDCFTCGVCGLPILTSQFSSRDGEPFHIHCQLPDIGARGSTPRAGGSPGVSPVLPLAAFASPSLSSVPTPLATAAAPSAPSPVGYSPQRRLAADDALATTLPTSGDVDVCHGCYQVIRNGLTTTALGKTWHPDCFTCGKCAAPVRENVFKTEGLIPYHVNCKLADPIRICRGCFQVINGNEITEAMDELWHPECFVCRTCGLRIHGREFTREGVHPVHIHCKLPTSAQAKSSPKRITITPQRRAMTPSAEHLRSVRSTTTGSPRGSPSTREIVAAVIAAKPTCHHCGGKIMETQFLASGGKSYHSQCIARLQVTLAAM